MTIDAYVCADGHDFYVDVDEEPECCPLCKNEDVEFFREFEVEE